MKSPKRKRRSDRGKKHRVNHITPEGRQWFSVRELAAMNGVSVTTQQRLCKLAGRSGHPPRQDLLDLIAKGKISVTQAIDMMDVATYLAINKRPDHDVEARLSPIW